MTTKSALVEGGEKPIDRTKFPYMWEGKRPSETIIHQVINKYMGEKDREYDNDQFKYYLNNWHGHAELNRRMRAAVEAVYATPPSRNDTISGEAVERLVAKHCDAYLSNERQTIDDTVRAAVLEALQVKP
jgi:hypothetical protein